MDVKELIKTNELLLRAHKVLGEGETIYIFLLKPLQEINSSLNIFLKAWRDYLKPIPDVQNDRLFFGYIPALMSLSSLYFHLPETTDNEEITLNCGILRKELNEKIINELSPYIVSFLKWDFQRRAWKHSNDEYKISYLKKLVAELDEELCGERSEMIKKYIALLLDFFIDRFGSALSNPEALEMIKDRKQDAFKTFNQLKVFAEKNKIKEFVDSDLEQSFLHLYKPMAQNYLEGLIKTHSEYSYLFVSFVEAQNDYKKFISAVLTTLINTETNYLAEIKNSLNNKDIDHFISILHSLFSSVPYHLLHKTNEAYYHIFVHLILKIIGCDIVSEVSTNIGRIDSVIEFEKLIYIIEFKISSSEEAINQIRMKKYAEPYLSIKKEVYGLGLSFNAIEKNINKEYSLELLL